MKKRILLLVFILGANKIFSQSLHLYGGEDHNVYLGCLNCSSYDSDSIWNQYGAYGNSYSSMSLWNEYGNYGSNYSSTSPWNNYASYPPIVVDKEGNFYGYFTINGYKGNRANFRLALILYGNYERIRQDVSGWYEKIFE